MRALWIGFGCSIAFALAAESGAAVASLDETCGLASSYDLTVSPEALVFERTAPAPKRIELRSGSARIDGTALPSNAESTDRLALFDRELRALVPKVKAVASHGVDLAAAAVRAEAAALHLDADTQAQLDTRLAARSAELKRRIEQSTTTRDWQGDAFDRYQQDIAADIAPLVVADLGTQAVAAALGGDLTAAAALRERAAHLQSDFAAHLQQRMAALRPQIRSLCPSMRQLYELQRDVRGPHGKPIDLLWLDASAGSSD